MFAWGRGRFRKEQIEEHYKHTDADGSVPLHRSYGVKRRVHPWREKAALTAGRVFVLWVLGTLLYVAGFGLVMFWIYFPEIWLRLLSVILILSIVLIRATRTIRKRRKFCRRLKKLCKNNKYRLTLEQNFFESLIWSADRHDFRLETGKFVYYVRYLTVGKYRSSLYFEQKDLIKLVKRPLNNKFTVIFDAQPRIKYYPIDFQTPEGGNKRVIKALVVNPVCEEMFGKNKDGGYEVTGNGGEHFGFTVFTGSGFLEAVKRNEKESQREIQY